MKRGSRFVLNSLGLIVFGVLLYVCGLLPHQPVAHTQGRLEPGRSIGTIKTQGDLIVMTLDEAALGKANMFDLAQRTLRFTPEGVGYRAENLTLKWDAEFGDALSNTQVTLRNFAFPFSGKNWDSFSVGTTGSISFGSSGAAQSGGPGGAGRGGGVV